jgi:hypothetical protein
MQAFLEAASSANDGRIEISCLAAIKHGRRVEDPTPTQRRRDGRRAPTPKDER